MEDILVIGGGLMGSSVAWKLSNRGVKVTLIEKQGNNYLNGSSFGTVRISRSLGSKKDVYSYAHNTTVKEVKKLIDFLNSNSEKQEHSIEDIYTTTPVSYLFHKDQYETIKKFKFKKQRKDFSIASQNSSFRKFKITIPNNTILVQEKRKFSGMLNPSELIQKLKLGLEKNKGQIIYGQEVKKITKIKDIFQVEVLNTKTKKIKTFKTKKIIVAAGAYTPSLLKEFAPYLNRIITPKKVNLSLLKIKDDCYNQLTVSEKEAINNAFPYFSQIGKQYFALKYKSKEGKSPIIKTGGHKILRNIHDLDKVWDEKPVRKDIKWARKKFKKHLEMLEIYISKKDIEEVKNYNCVYAESKNKTPLVTPIFDKYGSLDSNIIIITGMSGIGAKGCLCYGSLGADLILGKEEGKPNKMYKRLEKKFGNPSVNLYTKRIKPRRLF